MNFLRPFLAACLTLQFLMPLVPSWGAFLPHGHILRGPVTARDWQAHGENHRSPRTRNGASVETKILSIAANDGLSSVFASIDLDNTEALFCNLNPEDSCIDCLKDSFYPRAIDLAVLVPPPKK